MYIYAEVDPGFSEIGSIFKGRVWGAAPEDIGIVFLKHKNHIYCKILCMCLPFNPLSRMIQLTGLKTNVHYLQNPENWLCMYASV